MDWIRGERLGHGTFATVDLAVAKNHSSGLPPLMAVKSCGVSLSSSLMSEKLILDELRDCPEVITCYGDRFSYENGEKLYNVLLEYASGGALADHIKNSGDRRIPESDVRRYTKSLLRGLHYIHKFGYVHCDIKLQNILLCPNGAVKIADFGLAKRAGGAKAANPGFELRGTPLYMSPEMVAAGDQGPPADIWALGCVVSEMVTGVPAWRCDDVAALLMRIGSGGEVPEIPGDLSDEGRDFLEKCFLKSPGERWTAEMLLNHPFVLFKDQDFVHDFEYDVSSVLTWKDRQHETPSISPKCPFDFPDWAASSVAYSITSLPLPEYSLGCGGESGSWSVSAAERLRELVGDQIPDWSVSGDWINVR